MKTPISRKNFQWLYPAAILCISMAAFLIRWRGIEHITADIQTCLIPWSNELQPRLGISALKRFDGDYNMPYVTILWLLNYLPGSTLIKVKLFSILFDYLGACGAGLITAWFVSREKKRRYFILTYTLILFYPVTIMNSAYWGQCDFIYVTFLLYMILCLLQGRFKTAMILLGCAFSFKLQAILVLPFLLIYYWKKKEFSFVNFLLVPLMMEILCIPAIIGGYSLWIPFSVYFRQLGRYPYMYVFYPNFWALFRDAPYYIFKTVSMAGIFLSLLLFTVAVSRRKREPARKEWLYYAVWTIFLMMCFLPCMHERYGFLLEILLIIYAVIEIKMWWSALVVCAGTTISYLQVTFARHYFSDEWIAVAYLLVFGLLTIQMIRSWNAPQKTENEEKIENASGNQKMLNWEEKTVSFLNRYMLPLSTAVVILCAVLIRKVMIECRSADYLSNLIETADTHHTCFYMLGMNLLSYFDSKPLFFLLKLGCMAADLLAAGFCALVLREEHKNGDLFSDLVKREQDIRLKMFLIFSGYLILPSTLLNSGIWGHVDSLCIFLAAAGWLLWKKGRILSTALCWGISSAVLAYYLPYIALLILLAGYFSWKKGEKSSIKKAGTVLLLTVCVCVLLNFTGLLIGYSPLQCLVHISLLRVSGSYAIYPIIVFLFIMCFAETKWMLPFLILQLTVILDWGQFLYEEPLAPASLIVPGYCLTAGVVVLAAVLMRKSKENQQNAGITGE